MTLFLHAVETAHRLGLEITLTITSGWNLGAPFIQPKDAVKVLTWSRTLAEGGGTVLLEPSPKHAFYERIAVLAYPLRHGKNLAGKDGDTRASRANLPQTGATHHYTWTNIKAFSSSSLLLKSGLLGPVRLMPVYVQRITSTHEP